MPIECKVARVGDMHYNRALRVYQQTDGDMVVVIEQGGEQIGGIDTGNPSDRVAQVEFCVSGGRSRRTHAALHALMEAMLEDNRLNPIHPQE